MDIVIDFFIKNERFFSHKSDSFPCLSKGDTFYIAFSENTEQKKHRVDRVETLLTIVAGVPSNTVRYNIGIHITEIAGKKTGIIPGAGFDFESLWKLYPRKEGKADSLKHFNKNVKSKEDYDKLKMAVEFYAKEMEGVAEQFILVGSTFFRNRWEDKYNKAIAAGIPGGGENFTFYKKEDDNG